MLFSRYFVPLLLLWASATTHAQSPADTTLARQYCQAADSLSKQGEYKEANALFHQAQHLYQQGEHWQQYIACLNSIAYNLWPLAAYDSAVVTAKKALQLSGKHLGHDHPEAARAYDVLGIVDEYRGQLGRAMSLYKLALKIRQKRLTTNHPQLADSYENLGLVSYQMSSYNEAINYHQQALDIRLLTEPIDSLSVTYSYNNIGQVYSRKGFYQTALDYYQKVLSIRHKLFGEIHPGVAVCYGNIGKIYRQQGAYNQALAYYQKALTVNQNLFDEVHREIASSYNGLGSVYLKKKEYKQASIHYQKALIIYRKLFGETHPIVAINYNNLGTISVERGAYHQAISYYQKSLAINHNLFGQSHHEIAVNHIGLGVAYKEQEDIKKAVTHYQKALSIKEGLYGKVHPQIADIYNRIGETYQQHGSYEKALDYYQKGIVANNLLPSSTHRYSNPPLVNYLDGTILFRTINRKAQVLAKLDHNSLSFATYQLADQLLSYLRQSYQRVSDKSSLNENTIGLYEGALQVGWYYYQTRSNPQLYDTLFYLSERNKANLLVSTMSTLEAQRYGNVPDTLLAWEADLERQQTFHRLQLIQYPDSNQIRNQLFSLNQQYDSLIDELDSQYPNYYQLRYATRTASVPNIQQQLAPEEAVVSYFIGDSTYYAFAITPEHFRVVPLPVDTLLSERITSLRQMLSTDSFRVGGYQQTAYTLYQQLLAPVVADSTFAAIKKLTIIPDGVLGYLPFELLLTQPATAAGEYADLPYLLRDYTVRYGYSATWLFHPFSRPETSASNQYVAFAPHYPTTASDSVQQLAFGRFRNQVAPLRWSQHEAKNINKHLPGISYTQGAAVERRFKEEVSQYRVVHLAMHALIDDQNPMYSRLVFSQDTADTQEDGSLNAYELYNMEIPAELVVLSACETGYGKLERGEGIMSLARAFAYAGCPSIVMSHWLVDDKASAQLMDYFYRYLSEGLPKDEALRQAKLAYLETASVQKAHPFFWANFVLVGDKVPIVDNDVGSIWRYVVVGVILLLCFASAVYWYQRL